MLIWLLLLYVSKATKVIFSCKPVSFLVSLSQWITSSAIQLYKPEIQELLDPHLIFHHHIQSITKSFNLTSLIYLTEVDFSLPQPPHYFIISFPHNYYSKGHPLHPLSNAFFTLHYFIQLIFLRGLLCILVVLCWIRQTNSPFSRS